ncbi:MAG: Rab family GTPase [Promethearchaeia archaeon]
MSSESEASLTILVVGDNGVGKTTLIKKWNTGHFDADTPMTKRMQKTTKDIIVEGNSIQLNVLDIDRMYDIQRADGCVLVFDKTRFQSLENLDHWLESVRSKNYYIPILLVGTKADLNNQVQIDDEYVKEIKVEYEIDAYIKTSAKSGKNVERVFQRIANLSPKKCPLKKLERKIQAQTDQIREIRRRRTRFLMEYRFWRKPKQLEKWGILKVNKAERKKFTERFFEFFKKRITPQDKDFLKDLRSLVISKDIDDIIEDFDTWVMAKRIFPVINEAVEDWILRERLRILRQELKENKEILNRMKGKEEAGIDVAYEGMDETVKEKIDAILTQLEKDRDQ